MSLNQVHIGIIGAGRIGRVHAESLAFHIREARIVSIADVNRAMAEEVAVRCGIARIAASAEEVLSDPSVDAILICSSTDTHADLITRAAEAGKHIFCEKPIALDLRRIDAALAAVGRAGVKLQIGFNRRFDSNFARVHEAVAAGEIGTPHLLHIISRDPAPPPIEYVRVSGGIFTDMTIHDFDMARFLLGDEVDEIYTAAGVMVDPAIGAAGDVDTALLVLRFRNGAIGTIDNSRKAVYGYDQRVEVFGSGGSVSTANRFANQVTISTAGNIAHDLPMNFFMDRYADSFVAEMRAFVLAVRENRPTPVTGLDGRAPVVMAMAARRSHLEGRPVKLRDLETQS